MYHTLHYGRFCVQYPVSCSCVVVCWSPLIVCSSVCMFLTAHHVLPMFVHCSLLIWFLLIMCCLCLLYLAHCLVFVAYVCMLLIVCCNILLTTHYALLRIVHYSLLIILCCMVFTMCCLYWLHVVYCSAWLLMFVYWCCTAQVAYVCTLCTAHHVLLGTYVYCQILRDLMDNQSPPTTIKTQNKNNGLQCTCTQLLCHNVHIFIYVCTIPLPLDIYMLKKE